MLRSEFDPQTDPQIMNEEVLARYGRGRWYWQYRRKVDRLQQELLELEELRIVGLLGEDSPLSRER